MAGWLKAIIIVACVIVGLLLIAGIIVLLFFRSLKNMGKYVEANNTPREPNEQVSGSGDKKALIIYQPSQNDGTGDVVNALKEVLTGYTVTTNYPSEQLDYDLNNYDLIVFGSAIYAGEPSECLIEYIQSQKFEGKDVFVFTTGMRLAELEGLDKVKNSVGGINNVFGLKAQKTDLDKFKDFLSKKIS
jgi:flavodoxin